MTKSLVKPGSTPTPPAETASHPVEVFSPAPAAAGFFSFSYAVTEVSLHGDRTSVRAHQVRLQDGKLTTETFEGELDASVHAEALRAAQQQMQAQLAWLQRAFLWWLPLLPGHHGRD
jgi:hypothetical protein